MIISVEQINTHQGQCLELRRVSCEKCNSHFSYIISFKNIAVQKSQAGSVSSAYAGDHAKAEFLKKVKKVVEDKHMGICPCPDCSHIQGWMKEKKDKKRNIIVFLVITLVLFFGSSYFLLKNEQTLIFLAALIFTAVIYYKLPKKIPQKVITSDAIPDSKLEAILKEYVTDVQAVFDELGDLYTVPSKLPLVITGCHDFTDDPIIDEKLSYKSLRAQKVINKGKKKAKRS